MKNIKVGLPFVSKAYKAKTPRRIKIASECLIFTGAAVSIIAGAVTPPGWIVMVGGLSALTGRFLLKCFGEIDKE